MVKNQSHRTVLVLVQQWRPNVEKTVLSFRKLVVVEKQDDEAFGFEIQVRRSRPARCDGSSF